jgi:hypothetical protein
MATQHSLHPHARSLVQFVRQDISPFTFLAEILQNARRAYATGIWIQWQPESDRLTVWDNGSGIRSFDLLTNVGQPDWDDPIMRDENPSGIGFLAVVLATNYIGIRSQNWSITFNSSRFLNHAPLNATRDEETTYHGTHLTLHVKDAILQALATSAAAPVPYDSTAAWRQLVGSLVKGFPIRVYFNNDLLPRPHALNGGGHFILSEVGHFCLSGWDNCTAKNLSIVPALYCQGLPVQPRNATGSYQSDPDILHLPDRTSLTLPNHDQIHDEDKLLRRIIRARYTLWRNQLLQQAARLPIEHLAFRHWNLCISLNLPDLLHQAPFVPSVIHRYERPLTRDRHGGPLPWTAPTLPTAKDIFVYEIDPRGFDDEKPVTLASLYAAAAELPVLKQTIPDCHWSHQRAVDLLDPELGMTYTINGKTRSAYFVGQRVAADVVVCDSLTILFRPTYSCKTHPALSALLQPRTVTRWALYDHRCGLIVVPSEAEAGPVVRQITDYQDPKTGYFFRQDCHYDQRDLAELVETLRNNSPADYLNNLLSSISPDPEFIGNSPYSVRYHEEKGQLVVTVQADAKAPSSDH